MDYEKKYKDAVSAIKFLLYKSDRGNLTAEKYREELESIIPELKESEERIRKVIADIVKAQPSDSLFNGTKEKCLAWLEKQGTSYTKKDVDDAYLEGVTNTKDEIEKQHEANYQIRKDIATFIFNYRGDIKDRTKWMDYLGIKVSFVEMQGGQETLCDKCRKEHPSHSCQDITELGRCAVEHEQKTTDKVEPKFHKGDWLCENEPNNYARFIQIIETVNVQGKERYRISRDIHNDEDIVEFDFVEKYYHKFGIQDANDGDILFAKGSYFKEYIFIYSGMTEDNVMSTYCGFDMAHNNFDTKLSRFGRMEDFEAVFPATKEQRDLLFQKMKEAGYEWDAEKKEPKKIEQKPVDKYKEWYDFIRWFVKQRTNDYTLIPSDDDIHKWGDNILNHARKVLEQNPAWSEEDEAGLGDALWAIEQARTIAKDENDMGNLWYAERWLKSLKCKVQPQPKSDWSEEDEKILNSLISSLARIGASTRTDSTSINYTFSKEIDWLKSLRPQNTWKPSDEQMHYLSWIANIKLGDSVVEQEVSKHLNELLEDLKKLRED